MVTILRATWGYLWRIFMVGVAGWVGVMYLKDLEDPERWWN